MSFWVSTLMCYVCSYVERILNSYSLIEQIFFYHFTNRTYAGICDIWESQDGSIEFSAMSAEYLTPIFDIHGGGMDLIFPHHENEINAQSSAPCPECKVSY